MYRRPPSFSPSAPVVGSPTTGALLRADPTADDASVLCMLCTGTAAGAHLVATVNVRMGSTLAEVRSILRSLARGGDGGPAAVGEDPTNVDDAAADAILSAPLHPFDFTGSFCFVHSGGNRAVGHQQEKTLRVKNAIPRLPRFGVPANAAEWSLQPPAPLVVVTYTPGGKKKAKSAITNHTTTTTTSTASPTTSNGSGNAYAVHKRLALCVLYVAQGSGQESIQLERILAERLLLQQTAPTAPLMTLSSSSSSSSSPLSSYEFQQWCGAITRWNANVPDLLGRTILQEMATEGNAAAVKFLTAQSFVRLGEADRQGNTALHLAVMAGTPGPNNNIGNSNGSPAACVRLLLEAGADPLRPNALGNTPLHVALLRQASAMVGLICGRLRASGVVVFAAGGGGGVAASSSHTTTTTVHDGTNAVVSLSGADLRNAAGVTPVDLFERLSPTLLELCHDGSLLAVRSLVGHYLFNRERLTGRELGTRRTVLHVAAGNTAHPDVLELLLKELGSPVFPSARHWRDLLDSRLQTPLHIACAAGNVPATILLMASYTAFLSHQDINGDTPLMLALKHRRLAVVEALLANCAAGAVAANACDRASGLTALHLACGLGLRTVADALITHHGADVLSNSRANMESVDSSSSSNSSSATTTVSGVVVAPPTSSCSSIWDTARGERNILLVPAVVRPQLLEAARRMQRAQAGAAARRREKQQASHFSGHGGAGLDAFDGAAAAARRCDTFGGGRRGSTPLLCALSFAATCLAAAGGGASQQQLERAADVVDLIVCYGGLSSADDIRDALVFLLSCGLFALADRIFSFAYNNTSGDTGTATVSNGASITAFISSLISEVGSDNRLLCRLCEMVGGGESTDNHSGSMAVRRCIDALKWCIERRCCAGVNVRSSGRGRGNAPAAATTAAAAAAIDGDLPLVTCARVGNDAAARFLIESAGADPNVGAVVPSSSLSRITPLLAAIYCRQEAVVGTLIRGGARVSASLEDRASSSSGSSSPSALAAAAVRGLESVVSGLLGMDALNPFDTPRALFAVLMADFTGETFGGSTTTATATTTTTTTTTVTTSGRFRAQQLHEQRRQQRRQRVRVAEALARRLDPTACCTGDTNNGANADNTTATAAAGAQCCHPVELIHLCASRGFFTVAALLCDRLLLLPRSTLIDLVRSAPPPPSAVDGRPMTRIEPSMVPIEKCPWKRLLPNPRTGKGGLHRLPRPFDRLEVVNCRAARLLRRPPHRVELRDAFSYATEASGGGCRGRDGDCGRADAQREVTTALVHRLSRDIGLVPWAVTDMRGRTPADYALEQGSRGLTCLFLASGIAPVRRHEDLHTVSARGKAKAGTEHEQQEEQRALAVKSSTFTHINSNNNARRKRKSCPLVRAVHHSQRHHGDPSALIASALCSLVAESSSTRVVGGGGGAVGVGVGVSSSTSSAAGGHSCETAFAATQALRDVIAAQLAVHGAADLSTAGPSWTAPVVTACASAGRLDLLQLLHDEYKCRLDHRNPPSEMSPTAVTTPLLIAVARNDTAMAMYLLHAGCPPHEAAPLPRHRYLHRSTGGGAVTARSAASFLTGVKRAEERRVTPLCLAAYMGSLEMVRLLTSVASVVPATDNNGNGNESSLYLTDALYGLVHGAGARCGTAEPQELLLAGAVRCLAAASHPFQSPLILRAAAARGLVQTTTAIVECYGARAFLADITDPVSVAQVNSLHHFAADPRLCALLRSMLVRSESDEFGVAARRPTEVARAIVRLYTSHAGNDDDDSNNGSSRYKGSSNTSRSGGCGGGGGDDSGPEPPPLLCPVDWALSRGCAEGALLLMAVGLTGTGDGPCITPPPPPSPHTRRPPAATTFASGGGVVNSSRSSATSRASALLVARTQAVLRHWQRTRGAYRRGTYSVLHGAVELGGGGGCGGAGVVVGALAAEMTAVFPVSYFVLFPAVNNAGGATTTTTTAGSNNTNSNGSDGDDGKRAAPSLHALAALDTDFWRRWLPAVEDIALAIYASSPSGDAGGASGVALAPSDMFALIFSGIGVTRAIDAVLRAPVNHRLLVSSFTVLDPDFNAGFLAKQLLLSGGSASANTNNSNTSATSSLLVDSGRAMLTSFTPLTCAVAAGSLEWVQYIVSVNPTAIAYHRATATRVTSARERSNASNNNANMDTKRTHRGYNKAHPRRAKHHCALATRHGISAALDLTSSSNGCGKSSSSPMDAVVLSVSLLCDAVAAAGAKKKRNNSSSSTINCTPRVSAHRQIFEFLLRIPGALRRENVNAVAMAVATLRDWPLLELVMEQAAHIILPSSIITMAASGGGGGGDRFFFPLLPEEVPVSLRRVIGSHRHVMHSAARWGPRDTILSIARHSTRADIESGVDGRGRTCAFHALHHTGGPAAALAAVETLASLRVPMGGSHVCCVKTGRTPLMVAAGLGNVALVTLLLSSKPLERVINQQDRRGHTPLMLAAVHGHLAVVELLLASSADARVASRGGLTAAMLAAAAGHDHVSCPMAVNFSRVKDFFPSSSSSSSSRTSLLHCAAIGNAWRTAEAVCKASLSNSNSNSNSSGSGSGDDAAALMAVDRDGNSALHLAHCFGSARVIRAIIAAYYEGQQGRGGGGGGISVGVSASLAGVDPKARRLLASNAQQQQHSSGDENRGAATPLGEMEKRILRCDSSLVAYGWLRGVMAVNESLVREAHRSGGGGGGGAFVDGDGGGDRLRPGERIIAPQLPSFRSTSGNTTTLSAFASASSSSSPSPPTPPIPLLKWCAVTNNAVGLRVLADMNVADDCGALHTASRFGHLDCVRLLVSLDMSDPNAADEATGLFPFEAAAVAGHEECAAYLLTNTRADVLASAAITAVPLPPVKRVGVVKRDNTADGSSSSIGGGGNEYNRMYNGSGGGGVDENSNIINNEGYGDEDDEELLVTRYPHGLLHRLAPACGGAILAQAVQQLLLASRQAATLSERLWTLLQRPDEVGLTPFEYTIALGEPRAVLRCAQLLQQLAGEVARPTATTRRGFVGVSGGAPVANSSNANTAQTMESVTISRTLLAYLPNLSPAVRTLLFDVFSVEAVSYSVGFEQQPSSGEEAGGSSKDGATRTGTNGAMVVLTAASSPTSGSPTTAKPRPRKTSTTHRLTFADVRLLGINALSRDGYCAPLVNSVFTVDHERLALRLLMRGFPYRIRYEPEAFRGRTLAQQRQLLQWLSTSLVLSAYADAKPGDIDTIEVRVAASRGDQLGTIHGAASGNLAHSLYVSSGNYIVAPDVTAALRSTREAYKSSVRRQLTRLCTQATRAMRELPHPSLRLGTVTLDWNMNTIGMLPSSSSSPSSASAAALVESSKDVYGDRERWDGTVARLRTALHQLIYALRAHTSELLRDTTEADLAAVAVGGSGGSAAARPATITLRFVPSSSTTNDSGVTKFPPLSQIRGGGGGGNNSNGDGAGGGGLSCSILFDRRTITDARYAYDNSIQAAVANDVALVRVHYIRDGFLRGLRAALKGPMAREQERQRQKDQARLADGTAAAAVPTSGGAVANNSTSTADITTATTTAIASSSSLVRFKLELESASVAEIPLDSMAAMLAAAADVVERLLRPCASITPSSDDGGGSGGAMLLFHSSQIIAEALGRTLRTVLVLFTTRREPLVKYTGERLMLCFCPGLAPNAAEVERELRQSIVATETLVCRRLLTGIVSSLSQRLQSYLPQARLVVDLASIEGGGSGGGEDGGGAAVSGAAVSGCEDPDSVLSSLRVLTHKHSALVLEPLVEGLCVGWDGPVGACVRRGVRQVTVTLETGPKGSLCLTSGGNVVYYCPLQCVQRSPGLLLVGGGGGHQTNHSNNNTPASAVAVATSLAMLTSWQLLTSQQVASLLLLQLAVAQPEINTLIEARKPFPCWSEIRTDGDGRGVVAGRHGYAHVQLRNMLNRAITKPPTGDGDDSVQFRFVGDVTKVRVKALGKGRYRVKYTAPPHSGSHALHAFLHGQELAASPLQLRVRPDAVALERTSVLTKFNTVVADKPFEVLLRLTDAHGNRLDRAPDGFVVRLPTYGADRNVTLVRWCMRGPDTVSVILSVATQKAAMQLALEFACVIPRRAGKGDDDDGDDGGGGGGGDETAAAGYGAVGSTSSKRQQPVEHALPLRLECVDGPTFRRVIALRKGVVVSTSADANTTNNSNDTTRIRQAAGADHAALFFRKAIRSAERARWQREASALGGLDSRTFAPAVVTDAAAAAASGRGARQTKKAKRVKRAK